MSAHSKIHSITGSPLTLLGPEEGEKIGFPKMQALESVRMLAQGASEQWFCSCPAVAPASSMGWSLVAELLSSGFVTAQVGG